MKEGYINTSREYFLEGVVLNEGNGNHLLLDLRVTGTRREICAVPEPFTTSSILVHRLNGKSAYRSRSSEP
jgi:hypothetical protein